VSTVPPARLAALRACWHPVAYAARVTRAPHATTLLGEPLVLWRDAQGAPHAFRDVCVHRGTALSLGRVDGDEIVCAYHGWRYRGDGACTAIPQLAEPSRVPARARALVGSWDETTYHRCLGVYAVRETAMSWLHGERDTYFE